MAQQLDGLTWILGAHVETEGEKATAELCPDLHICGTVHNNSPLCKHNRNNKIENSRWKDLENIKQSIHAVFLIFFSLCVYACCIHTFTEACACVYIGGHEVGVFLDCSLPYWVFLVPIRSI